MSDLIGELNDQLNREITTVLRYMRQAASIDGAPNESVREMYLAEVTDELGHPQYLANQIEQLGGTPELNPGLETPPEKVDDRFAADAAEEQSDVKNYMHLAGMAEKRGLTALKVAMEEQAVDEDEHRMEMNRLRGDS